MKLKKDSALLIGIYALASILWAIFYFGTDRVGTYEGFYYHYVLNLLTIGQIILPFAGGLNGLQKAKKLNGWNSAIGKSLICLSLGLIAWSTGLAIWWYLLFFTGNEVPYPSPADVFFALSYPFWALGVIQLSKIIGAGFGLRDKKKLPFIGIALMCIFFTYYLLFNVAREGISQLADNPLKLLLDLYYPISDIIILTIVILMYHLSKPYLGGKLRVPIIVLFAGFGMNYLSDFTFSYTTTLGTYFNGHIVDLMFLTTMFLLSYAISRMDKELLQSG